jgi:hypothetical protein
MHDNFIEILFCVKKKNARGRRGAAKHNIIIIHIPVRMDV